MSFAGARMIIGSAAPPRGATNCCGAELLGAARRPASPSSTERRRAPAPRLAGRGELERARQRLAPVGEGVADQRRPRPGRRPARCGRRPSSAESTRGRGVNTARSTAAQQLAPRRRAGRARSASRRCASPARPAAARRSRAGPSPSSARAPAARRSCAGSAASRSSRAGWRPSRSAPGRARRGRSASRRPSASSTFAVLGGDRLERARAGARRARPRARAATRGASRSVSAPSPPPTSSTTSSGLEPASRDDRVEQVGVGEEVLAEAHRGSPAEHALRRWPRPCARARRSRRRATSATPSAVATTLAGWFGFPRIGCGARNGAVGLDQQQLVGDSAAASRSASALRVGDVAGERAVPARARPPRRPARAAPRSSAGSPSTPVGLGASSSKRLRRAPPRRSVWPPSRTWITSGFATRRAISIWASKARALVLARGAVAVVVEPGLADRDARRGSPASSSIRAAAASSKPAGGVRMAPDARRTPPRGSAAAAIASAFAASSMPTVRIRRTPTAAASATSSASGGSQSPRWAWLSIIAAEFRTQRSRRAKAATASPTTPARVDERPEHQPAPRLAARRRTGRARPAPR